MRNITFHNATESEQRSSVQNGTLQGLGDQLAMTIETHVEIPTAIIAQGRQAIEAELTRILAKAKEATFTITYGAADRDRKDN